MSLRKVIIVAFAVALGGAAVFAVTPLARDLIFHLLPLRWTGEAERLAAALGIGPGSTIADLGAGNGAMITELARMVGPGGRAFASETTPERRARIAARAESNGVAVTVVEAADHGTNLANACCDAIAMRMVMHHIKDQATFARDLRRSIRAGGRVGIIDFAPGALPHLADDHGVDPAQVLAHFTAAGFDVETRADDWGGGSYLIVFRSR